MTELTDVTNGGTDFVVSFPPLVVEVIELCLQLVRIADTAAEQVPLVSARCHLLFVRLHRLQLHLSTPNKCQSQVPIVGAAYQNLGSLTALELSHRRSTCFLHIHLYSTQTQLTAVVGKISNKLRN